MHSHKLESNRAKVPDPPVDYQNSLLKLTENDKVGLEFRIDVDI